MEELSGRFVEAFIGMGAEIIALGLEEISREAFGAVAIVVAECGAERGCSDAKLDGGLDRVAPVGLRLADDVAEVGIENQVFEVGVATVGGRDVIEEVRADDASSAPDRSDVAEVEAPVIKFAGCSQLDEPLGIADDLACVEGVTDCVDQFGTVARERFRRGSGQDFAGLEALVLERAQDAGLNSAADHREWNGHFDGMTYSPFSGSLLSGFVEDDVNEGFAGFGVFPREDVCGNLDQERV